MAKTVKNTKTLKNKALKNKVLKNKVRMRRFVANEMTQSELAKRIGVTRQTVAAIEAGKYPPSLELAFKIADVFELDLAEIFSYIEED
jgi:putative transcriptional regulator